MVGKLSTSKLIKNDSEKPGKSSLFRVGSWFAPLFLAFTAGVSVAWFNLRASEPEKKESVQEKRNPPLEQIISDNKGTALDKARRFNAKGLLYFGYNDYEQAEASFERALEVYPDYEIAMGNLFNTKFVLSKFDEAITLLERLHKVREAGFQDDLCKCYLANAAHMLKQDRPVQAQANLNCFLELKPEGDDFYEGINLYLKIAGYYFARDDFKSSVRIGERLLEIVPQDYKKERARLHSNLAISYYGLAETENDANYLRFTQKHIRWARALDPVNKKIKGISEKCESLFQAIEASKK